MAATITITKGQTFGATETVTNTKLHTLVDSATATISGITVAEGGTGVATLTDGGILLGSGTGAITAMAVLADGAIVVGDGTTDPVPLTAFTSSTGTLKHESGGIEADISAIADGGIVVGTGTGTMAIRASALTAGAAGFLKHELGGLEFDVSAIAKGDVVAGSGTGTMGIIAASGKSDGDVLTLQADGTLAYETPASGASFEIGTFTRDTSAASGTQNITIGFVPTHFIFIANKAGADESSIGFDDGTNTYVWYDDNQADAGTWNNRTTFSINDAQNGTTDMYQGKVTTLGTTTTITWTKTGSPTGTLTVFYMAFA